MVLQYVFWCGRFEPETGFKGVGFDVRSCNRGPYTEPALALAEYDDGARPLHVVNEWAGKSPLLGYECT